MTAHRLSGFGDLVSLVLQVSLALSTLKVSKDQTGFIQQRQTFENIRRSLHALEQTARNKIKAMVVGLDAEKAFDSVRW